MILAARKLNPDVIAVSDGELRVVAEKLAGCAAAGLDGAAAEDCLALLHESWGAATLCELTGLRLLFDECAAVIRAAIRGELAWEAGNAALRDAFDIVPKLLDWLVEGGRDNPCLLIPEITALRVLLRKPPVYEYQVLPDIDWPPFQIGAVNLASRVRPEDLKHVLHLYQLGLVGTLRGDDRERGLEILLRCAGRLADISAGDVERDYWTVYQLVLASFANGGVALRPDRLRLLAAVEKQLRSLAGFRAAVRANPYPEGLWRAFLALLAMSTKRDSSLDWVPLPALGFLDGDIERIRTEVLGREKLPGPSPFQELERRALRLRNGLDATQDGRPLAEAVRRELDDDRAQVARIARDLGLTNIAECFAAQAVLLADVSGPLGDDQVEAFADSVLYLECALADFAGANPGREQLEAWGARSPQEILQSGLAKAARNGALMEMGTVLSGAKARIEALQDGIIADDGWREIELGFASIEGAAQVLAMPEVASIVQRAREFVQTSRYHPELGLNDRARNLDLFADLVIGLEVHFDDLRHGRDQQSDSLRIAGDCAAALRF
jgi:hypothetical protein